MTTLDYKRNEGGHRFFSIYKPGQGKWVRWGTVAGLAIVAFSGAYWLGHDELAIYSLAVRIIAAAVWIVLWGGFTFWAVNTPKLAEFMILTESEMKKVAWPSRKDVINSTKVIIVLTLLLGLLLWVVDLGFVKLFQTIGVS